MWPFEGIESFVGDAARFFLMIFLAFITIVAVAVAPAKHKLTAMVFGIIVILFVFFYNDIMAALPL